MSSSKKPRHRHTSEQLEQLNSLYIIDEHPSLEQRQILAEALGMETKTVNSWFQNKRASAQKKANRVASHSDKRASTVSANQDDSDDYDPDYAPSSDPSKSKARNRLSNEQLEALRQSFILNDMPTPAERESLANQLNLSVQSVTNWFQNQRSIVKKTPDDIDVPDVPRQYSAYPPPSSHPSLPSLPPASTHPSIPSAPPLYTRPTSASPESSSRAALRRSTTPYTASSTASGGRRRSRPEPHQLAALHSLYRKSSNPSIHDRNILAAESGMDVEKVSNWFRNMRQNDKRRRPSQSDVEAEGDGDGDSEQAYTLSPHSSPAPTDHGYDERHQHHPAVTRSPESDMISDEEEEAVTPPPPSVSGGESTPYPVSRPVSGFTPPTLPQIPLQWVDNDPSAQADLDKRPRVDVEGALLLLSFHSYIVKV